MLAGSAILLADFDRIDNSNFFKRFIPVKNSFANESAIANGSRVFDVVNDWLFGRTQAQLWIAFLKVPTVDVTYLGFVVVVLSVVARLSQKVTNALISFARLETF